MELSAGGVFMHDTFGDSGAGGAAVITVPVHATTSASIGVVGGVMIVPSFHTRMMTAFGGGIEVLLTSGPKVQPYIRGMAGMLHQGLADDAAQDPDAHTRSDFGFSVGGGAKIVVNKKMSAYVSFNMGFLKESTKTSKGYQLGGGVRIPIGPAK